MSVHYSLFIIRRLKYLCLALLFAFKILFNYVFSFPEDSKMDHVTLNVENLEYSFNELRDK